MSRVLKPEGRIALEVGEVRKGKLKLEEQIILAGKAVGLKVEYTLINNQTFAKTPTVGVCATTHVAQTAIE
jgi:hypothetical protein